MNRLSLTAAALFALASTAPAHAEKSDRVMVETMRARILAARDELGANGAGKVELSEAEARLRELSKALDNNEAADARASVNGIEALIAAARIRARAPSQTPAAALPAAASQAPRKRVSYIKTKRARPVCRARG